MILSANHNSFNAWATEPLSGQQNAQSEAARPRRRSGVSREVDGEEGKGRLSIINIIIIII